MTNEEATAPDHGAVLSGEDFLAPEQFEDPEDQNIDSEEPTLYETEVFSVNWLPVSVFRGCLFYESPGFDRVFALGIPTSEILAACTGMRIPKEKHEEIIFAVRIMSGSAAKYLNTKRVPKK